MSNCVCEGVMCAICYPYAIYTLKVTIKLSALGYLLPLFLNYLYNKTLLQCNLYPHCGKKWYSAVLYFLDKFTYFFNKKLVSNKVLMVKICEY